MSLNIKIGDRIAVFPYEEVKDKFGDTVFGIPKKVYKDFEVNYPRVTKINGYEDGPISVEIVGCDGNNYTLNEKYIELIFPSEDSSNSVNHPSHYNQGGMEVWDVIKAFTSNLSGAEAFYTGNAIKYILRWDKKNGIEDLEKAKVYIDKIIEGRKEKQS